MRRPRTPLAAMALTACLICPPVLFSQEHEAEEAESHAAEGEYGEEFEKNTIAVFLGATQAENEEGGRDDPEFTLGFDYERRLTEVFGLGGILDLVLEGHREAILAAAGFFHWGEAKFVVAPGAEREADGDVGFIMRFGAQYGFPAGELHLEPSLFYDVTEEGGTWVFGLTFAYEF